MLFSVLVRKSNICSSELSLVLFLVGLGLAFFWLLGLAPIAGSSEAREGQVISSILRNHDWIVPLRNGLVPSKPPLAHWIGSVFSIVIGEVNEFSIRAASSLASILSLLLVLIIVRAATRSNQRALFAGFVLVSSYGFFNLAVDARVDAVFNFFVFLSLFPIFLCFIQLEPLSKLRTKFNLFWTIAALAVLAKGPLGFVLPVLIVFVWLCFERGLKESIFLIIHPCFGQLLFFAVVGLFYYLAADRSGEGLINTVDVKVTPGAVRQAFSESFISRQIIFENIERFIGGNRVNSQVWWYYIPSLLRTAAPWIEILILVLLLKKVRVNLSAPYPDSQIRIAQTKAFRAAIIWLLVGVLFFSLASGKRHSYLVSIFPAIAVLFGVIRWDGVFGQKLVDVLMRLQFWRGLSLYLVCAIILLLGLFESFGLMRGYFGYLVDEGLIWLVEQNKPIGLLLSGFLLILVSFVYGRIIWNKLGLPNFLLFSSFWSSILIALRRQKLAYRIHKGERLSAVDRTDIPTECGLCNVLNLQAVCLVVVSVFLIIFNIIGEGVKGHFKRYKQSSLAINSLVDKKQRLVAIKGPFDEYFDGNFFYLDREVVLLSLESEDIPKEAYVMVMRSEYEKRMAAESSRMRLSVADRLVLYIGQQAPDQLKPNFAREVLLLSPSIVSELL